jgi:hypothetical protein
MIDDNGHSAISTALFLIKMGGLLYSIVVYIAKDEFGLENGSFHSELFYLRLLTSTRLPIRAFE